MKWISVRVVEADTHELAIEEVIDQAFDEGDRLCDCVIPLDMKLRRQCEDAISRWIHRR